MKRSLLAVPAAALLTGAAVPVALAHTGHTAGTSVTVTAAKPSEFSFALSSKSVKAGSVTFKVTNGTKVGLPHDFEICSAPTKATSASALPNTCAGKKTPMLPQGKSATLTVTLKAGSYEYLCTVPGHAAGGMKGILKVM